MTIYTMLSYFWCAAVFNPPWKWLNQVKTTLI